MITFLRYCTTDSGSFQCDVDRNLDGVSLSDRPPRPGRIQVDAVDGLGC